jgi:hypothetical protein
VQIAGGGIRLEPEQRLRQTDIAGLVKEVGDRAGGKGVARLIGIGWIIGVGKCVEAVIGA